MVICERVCRCGRGGFAQAAKLVVRACDPELTVVCADCPPGEFAIERDIMGQLCPPRCSLPRFRDALVHHTTDAVPCSLLRSPSFWLPTLPAKRHAHGKHVKDAAVLKEHVALQLSVLPLASWPLSGVSEDCASTLESVCGKYGSLSMGAASRASPALTL